MDSARSCAVYEAKEGAEAQRFLSGARRQGVSEMTDAGDMFIDRSGHAHSSACGSKATAASKASASATVASAAAAGAGGAEEARGASIPSREATTTAKLGRSSGLARQQREISAATGAGRMRVFLEYSWALGTGFEELSMSSSDDAAAIYARARKALGGCSALGRRGVCLPKAGRLGDLLPRLATVILQAR